jgi:hypothetical protein
MRLVRAEKVGRYLRLGVPIPERSKKYGRERAIGDCCEDPDPNFVPPEWYLQDKVSGSGEVYISHIRVDAFASVEMGFDSY